LVLEKLKIVSLISFEIVARTHARVLYSCPRLMIGHFEEVRLSINLGNVMKLGRPTFPKIFIRPHAWILYSFLTEIFLLRVVLENECRKQNWRMNM